MGFGDGVGGVQSQGRKENVVAVIIIEDKNILDTMTRRSHKFVSEVKVGSTSDLNTLL